MLKRLFDIVCTSLGFIVLFPLFAFCWLFIKLGSEGPVFYKQKRVGMHGKDFELYKFRTMNVNADKMGELTLGNRDPRVTSIGFYLRKYKLDELPQLINIIKGDMSLVGPRPEVRKYVDTFSSDDMQVLSVRPGLTDYATLVYKDKESEVLINNPENFESVYINQILREKLRLNKKYIREHNLWIDIKIIFKTVFGIFK